jgi:tetratricopeptide (TPR) repeat protein
MNKIEPRAEIYSNYLCIGKYIHSLFLLIFIIVFIYIFSFSYHWIQAEKHREFGYAFQKIKYYNLTKYEAIQGLSHIDNMPVLKQMLGLSYLELGEYKNAINILNSSLKETPYNTSALFNLSLSYRKLKMYEKELKILKKIVKIKPQHFRAQAAIARIYFVLDDIPKASEVYNNMKLYFIKQKKRKDFHPYYGIVGKTAILVKDYKFAIAVYTEFLKKTPSAENFKILGSIYLINPKTIEEKSKGIDLFVRALKINPNLEKKELMIKEINNFKLEFKNMSK